MMTIGVIYRSGSANIATTGTGSRQDMDSAIVAIHETTNGELNSQQRQCDHRQSMRITRADSAIVAIRDNYKSRQCQMTIDN
jgi:hypothetical protein